MKLWGYILFSTTWLSTASHQYMLTTVLDSNPLKPAMRRNLTSVQTELPPSWSSPEEWMPWEVQCPRDLIISLLPIVSRRWGVSCPWLLGAFRTTCILNTNNSRSRGIPPEKTFWHLPETEQHAQERDTFLSALQKDTWDPTEVKRRQVQKQVHEKAHHRVTDAQQPQFLLV